MPEYQRSLSTDFHSTMEEIDTVFSAFRAVTERGSLLHRHGIELNVAKKCAWNILDELVPSPSSTDLEQCRLPNGANDYTKTGDLWNRDEVVHTLPKNQLFNFLDSNEAEDTPTIKQLVNMLRPSNGRSTHKNPQEVQ